MVSRSHKRSRKRSNERGAAMFIVLMVVMILSAIGTFALANARYEVQAAGFTRYRSVSQDIAQFGASAAMAEVGGDGRTAAYLALMGKSPPVETCVANAGVIGIAECKTFLPRDIELKTGLSTEKLFRLQNAGTKVPGSFGLTELSASFLVELTERVELQRPVEGFENQGKASDPRFYDLTVSSTGIVFVDGNSNGTIDATEQGSAVFTRGRGHMVVGPIKNPNIAPPPTVP